MCKRGGNVIAMRVTEEEAVGEEETLFVREVVVRSSQMDLGKRVGADVMKAAAGEIQGMVVG